MATNKFLTDITVDGKVGIGTTDPGSALHVAGAVGTTPTGDGVHIGKYSSSGNVYGHIQLQGNKGGYIDFSESGTDWKGRILYDNDSNYMRFDTSATERMRITASGNVGIGTTSAALFSSGWGRVLNIAAASNYATVQIAGANGNGGEIDLGDASVRHAAIASLAGSHLGFYTNSTNSGDAVTQRMVIRSNGNVGIGTTSPLSKLQVYGNTNGSVITKVTNDSNGTAAYSETHWESGPSGNELRVGVSHNYASTEWNNAWVYAINKDLALKAGSTGKSIKFYTNGTGEQWVRAIIDSSGNVGIGTTSPNYKLDINGNVNIASGQPLRWGSGDVEIINSSYNLIFKTYDGTDSLDEHMRITSAGNVGIGTTSPTGKLTVSRAGVNEGSVSFDDENNNAHLVLEGSDARVRLQMGTYNNGSYGAWIQASYDNNAGGTGSSGHEPLILNPEGGNVGIGTNNPSGSLDIYGTTGNKVQIGYFTDQGADDPTLRMFHGKATRPSYSFTSDNTSGMFSGSGGGIVAFATSANERMRITSSGNVGIGTTNPGRQLELRGQGVIRLNAISGGDPGLDFNTSDVNDMQIRYRSVTDALSIYSYGTSSDVLTIKKSDGKVGIGNTSPHAELVVEGKIDTSDTDNGAFRIYNGSTFRGGWGTANWAGTNFGDSSSDLVAYVNGSNKYFIGTNAQPRLTVDGTGNVGIGTTSPAKKLHVNGSSIIADGATAIDPDVNDNSVVAGAINDGGGWAVSSGIGGRAAGAGDTWAIGHNGTSLYMGIGNGSAVNTLSTFLRADADGTIALTAYDAGILKTDSSGNISVDTNTYITASGAVDTDAYVEIGRAHIGAMGHADYAGFSHIDQNGTGSYALLQSTSGATFLNSASGQAIRFRINNADKIMLASNGQVGIGTTSPSFKLDVTGSLRTTQTFYLNGQASGYNTGFNGATLYGAASTFESETDMFGALILQSRSDGNNRPIVFVTGATPDERMRIAGDGNVGIGTTSPGDKFTVQDGTVSSTDASGTNYAKLDRFSGLTLKGNGAGSRGIQTPNSDALTFGTNNTERMRIDSGGRVFIGTTTYGANNNGNDLIVGSTSGTHGLTIVSQNNSVGIIYFGDNDNNDAGNINYEHSNNQLRFVTNRTQKMVIDSTGNVGIGTTSPSAPLDVRASSYKVVRLGNDITSHYTFSSGTSDNTLTLTCGSYYQAEIVITANQTNSGGYNNWYVRGLWSNNHTTHHWDILEEVGYLTGSDFSFTNGQNDVENSGKLVISHTYNSGSFGGMTVRVTDMYGTHSYSIS